MPDLVIGQALLCAAAALGGLAWKRRKNNYSNGSAVHTKLPTGDHSPSGSFFYIANSGTVSLSILAPFSSALWYT